MDPSNIVMLSSIDSSHIITPTEYNCEVDTPSRTRHQPPLYIAHYLHFCEEWDRLVQNPFLAFYQRWPWFAHYTPLLNLWTITRDTAVVLLFLFLPLVYCRYGNECFFLFSRHFDSVAGPVVVGVCVYRLSNGRVH